MAEHAIRIGGWRFTAEKEMDRDRRAEKRESAPSREKLFFLRNVFFREERYANRALCENVNALLDEYVCSRMSGTRLMP